MRTYSIKPVRLLLLLILLAPGMTVFSQTKSTRNGSVSGHVTIRGKSAAGIVIAIRASGFSPQPTPSYKGTTDAEGNYRIGEIPPGSYQVAPIAPAYVLSGNQKVVIITEGEAVEDFNFALVRGGVVTGRVTDAEGRAVIEERVYLVSPDPPPQQGTMASTQGAATDDRGIYRIFGIREGRYRVAVGKNDRSFFDSVTVGRRMYQQTFHADASDPTKAMILVVGEGTESTNIDIVLGPAIQTFNAIGRAVSGENGQPVPNVRFGLRAVMEGNARNSGFAGTSAVSNSRGEFRLENLMPGKYATYMLPMVEDELFADAITFELIDRDVTDLLIKTNQGASITGTVTLEGTTNKDLLARLSQLSLNAWVTGDEMSAPVTRTAVIGADGSFRLAGLQPGKVGFGFPYNHPLAKGLVISRIEREGVSQAPGIQTKAGEQISGVRVVVVYGGATVRGVIKTENGSLPPEARFHIQLNHKPGELPIMVRPIDVDARGKFLIESLPAGTHELIVSMVVPGSKERPRRVQQQINVVDGENDITVLIDVKSTEEPRP